MYTNIEPDRGDDNIYITRCPELNLYANANTQKEAVAKLKKKIAEYIDKSDSYTDAKEDIDYSVHYYSCRFPQTH